MAQVLRYKLDTDLPTITVNNKDFNVTVETTPITPGKYEVYNSEELIDDELTATIGLNSNGRITIPQYVRQRCNINEDTRFLVLMEIREDDGLPNRIILEPTIR